MLAGVTTVLPTLHTGVMTPLTLSMTGGTVQLASALVALMGTMIVRSAGQVKTGGRVSTTVTVKVHAAELFL